MQHLQHLFSSAAPWSGYRMLVSAEQKTSRQFCWLLDADACCVKKQNNNTLHSQVVRSFLQNSSNPVLKFPGQIVAVTFKKWLFVKGYVTVGMRTIVGIYKININSLTEKNKTMNI